MMALLAIFAPLLPILLGVSAIFAKYALSLSLTNTHAHMTVLVHTQIINNQRYNVNPWKPSVAGYFFYKKVQCFAIW